MYFISFQNEENESNFKLQDLNFFTKKNFLSFSRKQLSVFYNSNPSKTKTNFIYEDEDFSVFMYGNIYNLNELSTKYNILLEENLPKFLLNLYLKVSVSFFQELNGDFLILYYDLKKDTITLVRDHLGIVPVFHFQKKSNHYFSSDEILLSSIFIQKPEDINLNFVLGFFKTLDSKQFFHSKLSIVLPGHFLEISSINEQEIKYWFPEKIKQNNKINKEEIQESYEKLLKNAVEIRVLENIQNASHLSGGLDSAFINAHLKQLLKQNFKIAFSQSSKNIHTSQLEFDEKEFVEEIAKTLNLDVIYSDETLWSLNKMFTKTYPHLSSFIEFNMLNRCNEKNIHIIFSGYAGDNFASVNNEGLSTDIFFKLKWGFFKRYPKFKTKIKYIILNVFYPLFAKYDRYTALALQSEFDYLNPEYQFIDKQMEKDIYFFYSRKSRHLRDLKNYSITRNIEHLVQLGDSFGVEYRFPLIDKRIVEFMISLPSEKLVDKTGVFHNRILMRKLCARHFSEKIWNRRTKSDPSVDAVVNSFSKKEALRLIKDVEKYKIPMFLKMINFEKLENDISKFDTNNELVNDAISSFLVSLECSYQLLINYGKIPQK